MKKCIFSLGVVDRKLIWTFIYALSQILLHLVNNKFLKGKHHVSISQLGTGVGQIAIIFIPIISCYKDENKSNEKKCSKKNVKYFSYLILLGLLMNIIIAINILVLEGPRNHHESDFCSKEGVELILLTLITLAFLKYKYFIHHLISLLIFCIICVCIDLLIDNWTNNLLNKKYYQIIMFFVIILIETFNYCYQKYMMDKLYYHYWNITLANGISLFIQNLGGLLVELHFKNESLKDLNAGYITLGFFISVIIGFFQYLSRILILDYFSPNHLMITYVIMKIYFVLTINGHKNKWYSLIFFAFQFFILMFYLEILELNFCGLNKNTKRNVAKRAVTEELIDDKEERSDRTSRNSQIDVGSGYIFKQNSSIKVENELMIIIKNNEDEDSIRDSQINKPN